MRKNITAVILFGLALCAIGGILSRCGRDGTSRESGGWQEGRASSVAAQDAPGGSPERDYAALQEELRPCVLQIFCGDYRGSGVIWKITDKEVTVISSAHLLQNGETCTVLCHAGVYYEAKVDRILENCDIGFAVFPADTLKEDGVELAAVSPSERGAKELVRGEELVVYGSMDVAAGDFVKGYLLEAESSMQLEGYREAQPLLFGGIVGETAQPAAEGGADADRAENSAEGDGAGEKDADSPERGAVDAGMSGGGVFDRSGKLLGILAGGDGVSRFVAVPVWRIEA